MKETRLLSTWEERAIKLTPSNGGQLVTVSNNHGEISFNHDRNLQVMVRASFHRLRKKQSKNALSGVNKYVFPRDALFNPPLIHGLGGFS